MSGRTIVLSGAVVTGLVAAAAVVGAALMRDGPEPQARLPGGVSLAAFLEPLAHRFADPVEANIEVVVDARRIRPETLALTVDFAPYTVTATTRSDASSAGMTSVRWRYRLTCLRERCRPAAGTAREFRFAPVRASFRRTNGRSGTLRREWHPLRAVSRLDTVEASWETFIAREHPLPPVSYRIAPGPLAVGLAGAAAILALLGGALAWWALGPLLLARIDRARFSRLTSLERELVVLRDAVDRSDPATERKALDSLARELRRNGNGTDELVLGARRLAWAEGERSRSDVLRFADDVESHAREERP